MTSLPTDLGFSILFAGRADALGSGKGPITRKDVTAFDYADHLEGKGDGIGVFPLLDDGTVHWGCIDLDEPDFGLAVKMATLVPGDCWIEQSRSGNAHVWVFFQTPAAAWAVRAVLRHVTSTVGRADVEIFPKQDSLRPGGVGNFVNLPYHGAERVMLRWVSETGTIAEAIPCAEFVREALHTLNDSRRWETYGRRLGAVPPEEREALGDWGDRPVLHECAEYIIERALSGERSIEPGARHQVLFHLSCQLLNYRDMEATEAYDLVKEVNAAAVRPLDWGEVRRLFENARNGQYRSTGCDDPVMLPYVRPDCPIANGHL